VSDISYIFGLAFLILALVGVFAVFRALSTQAKGGGPHGKRTTMGERGRLDVGSPIFPPPPEVVDTNGADPVHPPDASSADQLHHIHHRGTAAGPDPGGVSMGDGGSNSAGDKH
jgi:hypothetical protein